jgi:hypothetical protein
MVSRLSLWVEAAKKNHTAAQLTTIQGCCTSLLKHIQHFEELQPTFMPGLRAHLDSHPSLTCLLDRPENTTIHLPSSFNSSIRTSICVDGLADIEDCLQFAHANEALEDLRCQLCMRTFSSKYKKTNVQSQGPYMCMRSLQLQIEVKISAA